MHVLNKISFLLVVIGGLNWGTYALDINLVEIIFGSFPIVEKAVYILVGLSSVNVAIQLSKHLKSQKQ